LQWEFNAAAQYCALVVSDITLFKLSRDSNFVIDIKILNVSIVL